MNNLWDKHVKDYMLVNKNNRLDNNYSCNIFKSELLMNEYFRKIKMHPFNFTGYIQFLRSIRDLLVPLTVNVNIRNDLYLFISEANRQIGKMYDIKYRFYIHSGYRSYKYQKNMYESCKEKNSSIIALPGSSEHQTGLSIDFGLRCGKNDCDLREKEFNDFFELLNDLAPNYGFILRYPKDKELFTGYSEEKWHFRYIGESAKIVSDFNLSYEEYIIATFIINNNINIHEFLKYDYLEKCVGEISAKKIRNNIEYLNDLLFFLENYKCKELCLSKETVK